MPLTPLVQTPVALLSIVAASGADTSQLSHDLLSVQTNKRMGDASGQWSVQLTGKTDAAGQTWQEKITPQDYVEISLGYRGSGGKPPVVMRGFVDNVFESFSWDQANRPSRTITISGQDMGKGLLKKGLWTPSQIDPTIPGGVAGVANYYSTLFYPRFTNDGLSPAEVMSIIMESLYRPSQVTVLGVSDGNPNPLDVGGSPPPVTEQLLIVPRIEYQCTLPSDGTFRLFPPAITDNPGSVWNLFQYWTSPPFSELFFRDDPDAPRLYWRFPPFYDIHGNFLGKDFGAQEPSTASPAYAAAQTASVLNWSLGKSDNEVITYYALWPATYGGGPIASTLYTQSAGDPSDPWLDAPMMARYGFSPLEVELTLMALWGQDTFDTVVGRAQNYANILTRLVRWSVAAFGTMDRMKSGQIKTVGTSAIPIGNYLDTIIDERTGLALASPAGHGSWWRYYVEGVAQNFQVPQGSQVGDPVWTTTFSVTRGHPVQG